MFLPVKERLTGMPFASWIVERARGSHPLNDAFVQKVFVMLQVYVDDSGTHDDSYACVVAGYFGGVNRWKEFERRWKEVLEKSKIHEFHAREFWKRDSINGGGVGKYRHLDRDSLDQIKNDLLTVIEKTEIYPFAHGVVRSVWDRLTDREKKFLSGGDSTNIARASANPMYFIFQTAVSRAVDHCKPGITAHFVVDQNQLTETWTALCHRQIRGLAERESKIANRIGELTFADSRIATPLQAADLLAYEAHRYCRLSKGDSKHPASDVYRRATRRMKSKDDFWLFDYDRLQQIIPRRLDEQQI